MYINFFEGLKGFQVENHREDSENRSLDVEEECSPTPPKFHSGTGQRAPKRTTAFTKLPKLVALALGDTFISDTGMEGGDPVLNRTSLFELLEPYLKEGEKETLEILKSIQDLKDSKSIIKKLGGMRAGEELITIGGYTTRYGGHALLYKINKEADDTFQFTVINTGAGTGNHLADIDSKKRKIKPFYILKNIKEEKILNEDFWNSILELDKYEDTIDKKKVFFKHNSEDIYRRILPFLGGDRDVEEERKLRSITPQRSGTCSFKCLLALLSSKLGESEYKRITFLIKYASLKELYEELSKSQYFDSDNIDQLSEFKKAIEEANHALSRYSVKQFKKGYISEKELYDAQELVSNLDGYTRTLKIDPPLGELKSNAVSYASMEEFVTYINKKPRDLRQKDNVSSLLKALPNTDVPKMGKELEEKLSRLIENSEQLLKHEHPKKAMFLIQKEVVALPELDNPYWEKPENALELAKQFSRLQFIYQWASQSKSTMPFSDSAECHIMKTVLFKFVETLIVNNIPENIVKYCSMSTTFELKEDDLAESVFFYADDPALLSHYRKASEVQNENAGSLFSLFPTRASKSIKIEMDKSGNFSSPTSHGVLLPVLRDAIAEDPNNFKSDDTPFSMLEAIYRQQGFDKQKTLQVLFGDPGMELLRSSYYHYLHLYIFNPLSKLEEYDNFQVTFSIDWKDIENQKPPILQIEFEPKHNRYPKRAEHHKILQYFYESMKLPNKKTLKIILAKRFRAYDDFSDKDPFLGNSWNRYPLWALTNKWRDDSEVPADIAQELAMLLNCPGEVGILKLTSYFSERIDLLMDEDYRLLFYYGLIRQNTLWDGCKAGSSFVEIIEKKIDQMISFSEAISNRQLKFFLTDLKSEIWMKKDSEQGREKSRDTYHSFIDEVKGNTHSDKTFKNQLLIHYLSTFAEQPSLSKSEIKSLVEMVFEIEATGFNKEQIRPHVLERYETLKIRLSEDSLKLSKDDCIEMGKKICQTRFNFIPDDFTLKERFLKSELEEIEIDLSGFVIIKKRKVQGAIDFRLQSNSVFQEFFDNRTIRTEFADGKYHIYAEENGKEVEYRMTLDQDDSVYLEKVDGEKKLRYIPAEIIKDECVPHFFKNHFTYWYDPSENNLYFEDSTTNSFVARAKLHFEKENLATVSKIEKKPFSEDSPTLSYMSIEGNRGNKICTFEKPEETLYWSDQTLQFPRLGLTFEKNEKGDIVWKDQNNFFLDSKQEPPKKLETFKAYLKLHDHQNETYYLIPNEEIDSSKVAYGGLSPNFELADTRCEGGYFLLKEGDQGLIGNTPLDNLFIAKLLLAHNCYDKCDAMLRSQLVINPKGYQDQEMAMLREIIEQGKKTNNNSPQAITLRTRALALLLKHSSKGKIESSFTSLYEKYLDIKNAAHPFALSHDEELNLVNNIHYHDGTPLFESRQFKLEGKTVDGKVEKSPFSPKSLADVLISTEIPRGTSEIDRLSSSLEEYYRHIQKVRPKFFSNALQFSTPNYYVKNFKEVIRIILNGSEEERRSLITKIELSKTLEYEGSHEHLNPPLQEVLAAFYRLMKQDPSNLKTITTEPVDEILSDSDQIEIVLEELFEQAESAHCPVRKKTERRVLDEFKKVKPQKQETPLNFEFQKENVRLPSFEIDFGELEREPSGNQEQLTEELKQCLKLKQSQYNYKHFRLEVARVFESLDLHTSQSQKEVVFQLDDSQLKSIQSKAKEKKAELESQYQELEDKIINLANTLPSTSPEKEKAILSIQSGKRKKITLPMLMVAYLQKDSKKLCECNPTLSQEELSEVCTLLTQYLIIKTEAQHLHRIESFAKDSIAAENEHDKQLSIRGLSEAIQEKRHYDPFQEQIFSVFESLSGFRLREKQVETIRELQFKNGAPPPDQIRPLIMGSGKTKVLLPFLCYLNSTGENNIPFIIVPDELFETNLVDMQKLSEEFFSQPTYALVLKENLTENDLEDILKKIENVKKDKSYCISTPKYLHQLRLDFIQSFLDLKNGKSETRFRLLKKILLQMKNEGDAVVDEADLVLECLKEVNATRGPEEKISPIIQDMLEELFLKVAKKQELSDFFELDKDVDKPFDTNQYTEKIVPLLIEIIKEMASKYGDSAFIKDEQLEEYLKGGKVSQKFLDELDGLDKNRQDLLALGKEAIQTFFPLVFSKNPNEHFGLSHQLASLLAIPYARSNTPWEGSRFGNHFETLMYTMVYYTRMGVSEAQLKKWIEQTQQKTIAEAEAIANLEGVELDIRKSPTYQQFQELKLFEFTDLLQITDVEINKMTEELNGSVEKRVRFVRSVPWNEIAVSRKKISSNAQDLMGMFRSRIGFTGTPYNRATYPSKIETNFENNTDGKTIEVLRRSNPGVYVSNSLQQTVLEKVEQYDALIDGGAIFRGEQSTDVARRILQKIPASKKGVIFFNDQDIPKGTKGLAMILERGEKEPKKLSESQLKPEERFTFYNITTGADIKQDPFAKGLVTVGAKTTLRDFGQAVWRLRDLDKKQHADFIISSDVEKQAGESSFEDLVCYCMHNQSWKLQEDTFRAFKQKMNFLITNLCMELALDSRVPVQLSHYLDEFFVQQPPLDPYESFGKPSTLIEISKAVEKYKRQVEDLYEKLVKEYPEVERIYPKKDLEEDLNLLCQDTMLPEEVKDVEGRHLSTREQVKTEQKTQENSKVKSEVNVNAILDQTEINSRDFVFEKSVLDSSFFTTKHSDYGIRVVPVSHYLKNQNINFNDNISLSRMFASATDGSKEGGFCLYEAIRVKYDKIFGADFAREGLCLIKRDRITNECNLTIVHPMEAQFVYKVLEKDHQLNKQFLDDLQSRNELYFKKQVEFILDHENKILTEEQIADVEDQLNNISDFQGKFEVLKNHYKYEEKFSDFSVCKYYTPINEYFHGKKEYFDYFLEKNQTADVILWDPKLGVVSHSKNTDLAQFKCDELLVQAKYLLGFTSYTKEEQNSLREWKNRQTCDVDVEKFFLENVIRQRLSIRERYERSILQKILKAKR